MLNSLVTTLVGVMAAAPVVPQSPQDAQAVLETMRARQVARWDTIDNYTVFQQTEGFELPGISESGALEVPMHFQKHDIHGEPAFGAVPANEYVIAAGQAGERGEFVNAEFFDEFANSYELLADTFDAWRTRQHIPALPNEHDPGARLRSYAGFADAGADAIREAEAGDFGRADAAATLMIAREMATTMRLVGRGQIDGREAFHLRADGLDRVITQPGDEYGFTLRSTSMWVDAEHYVTLRTSMEGEVEADGEQRSVTIEQLYEDYRDVGSLYESHRQVMRMSGLMGEMDPEERAELEESMRQIDELESQLDQMPAAARGMIERQIESARAQMEMVTGDGGLELVTEVLRIEINTGPPPPGDSRGQARELPSTRQAAPAPSSGPGQARDDLRRFRGLYGDPTLVPPRDLFVIETCDGHLVAGPTWADVASWHLTSTGDTEFEYADSFQSLSLTFEMATDGSPRSLRHTVDGLTSPLPHRGPLPGDWGDGCLTVERGR